MLKHFRILLASAVCVAIATLLPPPVSAAEESISTFESHISIYNYYGAEIYSSAEIDETFSYDFGGNERQTITRSFPASYHSDNRLNLLHVDKNGFNERYNLIKAADTLSLQIGHPNTYLSGVQTYRVAYNLYRVIDSSTFKFDIMGAGWDVPVERAVAKIWTPATASADCYVVEQDTKRARCQIEASERSETMSYTLSAQNLGPGDGLVVELTYPARSPANSAAEHDGQSGFGGIVSNNNDLLWMIAVSLVMMAPVLVFFIKLTGKFNKPRFIQRQLIVPQYEPPDGLTPAEIGILNDNDNKAVEFTAALIDLASRGYLRITRPDKKKFLEREDYKLELLKSYADARDYEKTLLDSLFGSKKEVLLGDLYSKKLSYAILKMHKNLIDRLVKAGYYKSSPKWYLRLAKGNHLQARLTDYGKQQLIHLEGFKVFLTLTKKERLTFHDAPAKQQAKFSRFLPHAIALGVETEWVKGFGRAHLVLDQSYQHPHHIAYAAENNIDLKPTPRLEEIFKDLGKNKTRPIKVLGGVLRIFGGDKNR